jgi:hypothetical protein
MMNSADSSRSGDRDLTAGLGAFEIGVRSRSG